MEKLKSIFSVSAVLAVVSFAFNVNAALTVSNIETENAGSEKKVMANIAFDSSYAIGGESLTAANLGLSKINRLKVSDQSGYTFEYDYTNSKLKVLGNGEGGSTITVTDDNTAASNGVAVKVQSFDGVNSYLAFTSPTTTDGMGLLAAAGNTFSVKHDGTPSNSFSANLYFDEDGTNVDERFLANTATAQDMFVAVSGGNVIRINHDASASSNGVQVYFDEDAANTHERLLFVSPTNVDGISATDNEVFAYTKGQVANAVDLSGLTGVKLEAYGH